MFSALILWGVHCHQIGFEVCVIAGPAVRNHGRNRFAAATNPIRAIAAIFATASAVAFWFWVRKEVEEVFQMDDDTGAHVLRQKIVSYPIATFRNQVLAVGYFRLKCVRDWLQWWSQRCFTSAASHGLHFLENVRCAPTDSVERRMK